MSNNWMDYVPETMLDAAEDHARQYILSRTTKSTDYRAWLLDYSGSDLFRSFVAEHIHWITPGVSPGSTPNPNLLQKDSVAVWMFDRDEDPMWEEFCDWFVDRYMQDHVLEEQHRITLETYLIEAGY